MSENFAIYHLTSFSVFLFLTLLQQLESLSPYMCGHNFTMNFPPDFHNYTGLRIPSPNLPLLHQINCKPHWSTKMKKKHHARSGCWEDSAKKLSYKPQKILRKIPVLESLSNTVKGLQAVRLATFIKEKLPHLYFRISRSQVVFKIGVRE